MRIETTTSLKNSIQSYAVYLKQNNYSSQLIVPKQKKHIDHSPNKVLKYEYNNIATRGQLINLIT